VRQPNRGDRKELADPLSACVVVDDDVFNPRSDAGRDPEEGQGQHSDDHAARIAGDEQARRGRTNEFLKLGPSEGGAADCESCFTRRLIASISASDISLSSSIRISSGTNDNLPRPRDAGVCLSGER
jgi:hypothetical protein